ncbi:hypothetical protein KCU89_g15893, partial [Aureobasidium melanogenum]
MRKSLKSKNKSSTHAKTDTSQEPRIMDENNAFAENQTTNEIVTNSLSKQPHKQVKKQTQKEVRCSNTSPITESQPTMDMNTETTIDMKHAINSVEDLERRLAESRRFADEMEEKLRRLVVRNRKVVGMD